MQDFNRLSKILCGMLFLLFGYALFKDLSSAYKKSPAPDYSIKKSIQGL